jgi:hypothetical protein
MHEKESIAVFRDFLEDIAGELANFSTSFVNLDVHNEQADAGLGGSGILIFAGGKHAILTADHVLGYLPKRGEVGLVFSTMYSPQVHSFTIDMAWTEKITIARGSTDFDGPDIGILLIPAPIASRIMVYKSFYNLSKRRDQILSCTPLIENGIWFLCGMPVEWTKDSPPVYGFQRVKEFRGICGVGIVTIEAEKKNFDYLTFEVKYNETYESPQDFKGMSGSGLWHIIVGKSEDGDPIVNDKILSGVAFYQSDIENGCRKIICHGRKSIYGAVVDTLEKQN